MPLKSREESKFSRYKILIKSCGVEHLLKGIRSHGASPVTKKRQPVRAQSNDSHVEAIIFTPSERSWK
jgi:sulfite reductase beta subunit-like hemoprotein